MQTYFTYLHQCLDQRGIFCHSFLKIIVTLTRNHYSFLLLTMAQLSFSDRRIPLLLIAFATLATCCMPAFNDFKYAENATLLEEIVAQYGSNPDMGWADVLGGTSPLQPWPKDNSGLVNIQYCWPDLETKSKLEKAIQGGWEMWHTRLGNGGPGSGHRIGGFSEYKHNGNMVFCWLDDENEECKP